MADFVLFDFDPRSLPAEYLQAIGLVIASAVQTESIVEDAIAGVFGLLTVKARILTNNMSMQVRSATLRTGAQERWGDGIEYDALDEALARVEKAIGERNRIAHMTWQIDPEGRVYASKIRARDKLKVHFEQVPVENIQAIAAEIYDAGIQLMKVARLINLNFPTG